MGEVMRRITLLCAFGVLLCAAPPALAQGGAAQCRQTVNLSGTQRVSSLVFAKGRYRLTVEDTSDLTCADARRLFREILAEPGGILPAGWQVEAASQTFTRKDGGDSFSAALVPPPITGGGFSWNDVQDWAVLWLPIIFLGLVSFSILWMRVWASACKRSAFTRASDSTRSARVRASVVTWCAILLASSRIRFASSVASLTRRSACSVDSSTSRTTAVLASLPVVTTIGPELGGGTAGAGRVCWAGTDGGVAAAGAGGADFSDSTCLFRF